MEQRFECYFGYIFDVRDAQLLIHAGLNGLIPMVKTKLSTRTLKMVRSGSIYIWNETETKLRRWRDGKRWSASRFMGKFLVYRELFKLDYPSYSYSNNYREINNNNNNNKQNISNKHHLGEDLQHSSLYKKTLSLVAPNGHKFRVVNYYHPADVHYNLLTSPSEDTLFSELKQTRSFNDLTIYDESTYPNQHDSITNLSIRAIPYSLPPDINKQKLPQDSNIVANFHHTLPDLTQQSSDFSPLHQHLTPVSASAPALATKHFASSEILKKSSGNSKDKDTETTELPPISSFPFITEIERFERTPMSIPIPPLFYTFNKSCKITPRSEEDLRQLKLLDLEFNQESIL